MLWIKEVEMAKSVVDLMTLQSIEGHDFIVFEIGWCEDNVCIEEDHL